MGTGCGKHHPPPDTTNVCTNDPIGQGDTVRYGIPHFCTLEGPAGDSRRREYCHKIGDREWGHEKQGKGCSYDDCDKVKRYHGCCKGCCAIRGAGVHCRRIAYRGDPAACCFRDKAWRGQFGDPDEVLCFETSDKQKTCPPDNRDITGGSCRDAVAEYCTGADLDQNDSSWLNRWSSSTDPVVNGKPNCVYAISRNLFNDPRKSNILNAVQPNPRDFQDARGFAWSRELLNRVFKKYADQGFVIGTLPGFPGYNDFQDDVLQPICTSVPGICQEGLFATCSNTTTEELVRNPAQVPWCGCYMSQDQYQKYVDEFQVNRECTPSCARQGNIPLVSANGIQPLTCDQDVCIIDDVTIDLERTNLSGNINFAEFCGGCSAPVSGVNEAAGGLESIDGSVGGRSSSSCLCIMTDDTIVAASDKLQGINLKNTCGQTQCFKENPNPGDGQPNRLQIPCDSPDNFNPFANRKKQQDQESAVTRFRRWVTIGLIVLIVAVIILFMLYLSGIGTDTAKKIITRKPLTPKPSWDRKALLQKEMNYLYGDQAGGSILDRGRGPLFPKAPTAADMKGSILNRNGMTPRVGSPPTAADMKGSILNRNSMTLSAVSPSAARGGCYPSRSILTRDCLHKCSNGKGV